MSANIAERARRLRESTHVYPFAVEFKANALVVDALGRSVTVVVPVPGDADGREAVARDLAAALNEYFREAARMLDPFDPAHLRAVEAESRRANGGRSTPHAAE